MARFRYIDTNGQERTIEAIDAQTAITTAVNIAPGSGVILDVPSVSPVTKDGIDISLIGDVGTIVPVPVIPPPVVTPTPFVAPPPLTVISSQDNSDGTTTNFLSDGTTDTGRITIGADGVATFTPIGSETVTSGLTSRIDAVKNEIRIIEDRMAGRSGERADALEHANVFSDMRALNRLNAELRTAQDRQIEVPIEERQNLRGRGATLTEFSQATRPGLEKAALQELISSRASSRLTDSINTNIKIIDTQIKADADRDEFIYKQKQDYLETLETNYANIITEQQKIEFEERKFQNELTRDAIKAERDARQKQLDIAAEKGATPAELDRLLNGSIEDIYGWNAEHAVGNEENIALQQSAVDVITLIDGILSNEDGLKASVGSTGLGKTRAGNIFGIPKALIETAFEELTGASTNPTESESNSDRIATFRGSAGKLVADTILQQLIDIKSQGATLGALSDAELLLLTNAATDLRPVKDGNDQYTGQFDVSEERFKEVVELMQSASMKVYIASKIGKDAYKQAGYVTSTQEDVRKTYEALVGTDTSKNSTTNFYQRDLYPTFDVIKREEGFSASAYKDSTGTWTIGFGNTMIDGRPVKASDKISRAQGEEMLRVSVTTQYSTGIKLVGADLNSKQKAALVSFEYNLGPGVWQTRTGERILALVSSGNFAEAGQLMQQYNKSRNPSTGRLETNAVLRERRAREAALLLS